MTRGIHVEGIAKCGPPAAIWVVYHCGDSISYGGGTHITGDVPGGLGTFDRNSICLQIVVLHLGLIPSLGVKFLGG